MHVFRIQPSGGSLNKRLRNDGKQVWDMGAKMTGMETITIENNFFQWHFVHQEKHTD
jgi:hypothetical protein